ncbi:MAG: ferrous iron transport protein A [Clostridiales bacterium]|jgi:Fe2+ transport system protein FeoA|nr:ferrous iron transport protein A [Clostridiales bacterium]
MPLTLMKPGETHVIRRISGPPDLRQRLGELGFVSGSDVTVVGGLGGDLILLVKGSRIALGQGMARHIHV